MPTMVPPQKGVEYIFYVSLISQANAKVMQNNPTLATGDVLVSTDGGATSNLDTLPAVTPASSDMVKVTVSATEMNGDNIIIVFSDVAGAEWCDLMVNIQTSAKSLDTILQILTGKWEVTGNQLIMYGDDGTTPLYTFDLSQDGIATEFNPDLREPV